MAAQNNQFTPIMALWMSLIPFSIGHVAMGKRPVRGVGAMANSKLLVAAVVNNFCGTFNRMVNWCFLFCFVFANMHLGNQSFYSHRFVALAFHHRFRYFLVANLLYWWFNTGEFHANPNWRSAPNVSHVALSVGKMNGNLTYWTRGAWNTSSHFNSVVVKWKWKSFFNVMRFMWLGHSYNQRTKIIVSGKNPGCNCAIYTYLKQISSLVYIYQYLRQNTCHHLYSSEGYKHNDLCSCCHCLQPVHSGWCVAFFLCCLSASGRQSSPCISHCGAHWGQYKCQYNKQTRNHFPMHIFTSCPSHTSDVNTIAQDR